jgi:hypothetical protein
MAEGRAKSFELPTNWRYDTSAGPFAELSAIDPAELRAAAVADLRAR